MKLTRQKHKASAHCCRNILSQCCSQCCMGEQTGRKQNIFCFRDANSTCSKYVAWVRKRGNNRKTIEVCVSSNVSQMLPRLRPHATYVEDKICILKAENIFEIFQNLFCVLDTILTPQQCFLICTGLQNWTLSGQKYLKLGSKKCGTLSLPSLKSTPGICDT